MTQEHARRHLVEELAHKGIHDPRVLAAMLAVPRHAFVPPALAARAYEDVSLPIGEGQTISQPYVVAWMTQALELAPADRVLEVGTGSGYGAAVLSQLAREVYSIERVRSLAFAAADRLRRRLGLENIVVQVGDGSLGWPEAAPFDAISVTAGAPLVPPALVEQLAVGGRLVIPVGRSPETQELLRIRRVSAEEVVRESLGAVMFVPLVGEQGWRPRDGSRP